METLDIIALIVLGLFALNGLRRGLIVGVLSLAGLVVGAVIGSKVAPSLLSGETSRYVPVVALGGAVLLSGVCRSIAALVGRRLRSLLFVIPPLKVLDVLGGGLLGAATGLALCWAVGAVLLYIPGQSNLRRQAQDSAILSTLNREFPPGRLMDALGRIDPIGALAGPGASVDPPDPADVQAAGVRRARASVVRLTGYACGLGVSGSGWIAGRGLVVTAAHVVAGVDKLRIDRGDGKKQVTARVVSFDPQNDVAVVSAPRLEGRPLETAPAREGDGGAALGYPGGGALTTEAARVGRTVPLLTRDAYGNFPVTRTVTLFRGNVDPGSSGGPIVSTEGRVLTTVFAERATDSDGGFGVPTEAMQRALEGRGAALDTQCAGR